MDPKEQFLVDLVIVECNGCKSTREYPIDPPFTTVPQFVKWQESGVVERCTCGHPTVDLKLRMKAMH